MRAAEGREPARSASARRALERPCTPATGGLRCRARAPRRSRRGQRERPARRGSAEVSQSRMSACVWKNSSLRRSCGVRAAARASRAAAGGAAAEALDPAAGVDQLLLARVERVAVRADLDVQLGLGRAGRELVAAGAADVRLDVLGMDLGLHRVRLECLGSSAVRAERAPEPRLTRAHQVRGRPKARRRRAAWPAPAPPSRRAAGCRRSAATSAEVTGASSPARSIARASSRTVSSASTAWPRRSGISAAGTPCGQQLAGAAVARRRAPGRWPRGRRCRPGRRTCAPGRPSSSARASTSRKMSAAAMPAAFRPCAWVAPTATAAAFFATPGQLDADRIVGHLAHHAGALEHLGHPVGERLRVRGADQPRPGLDHLARVRGAADARDPLGTEGALERHRGRRAVRRHEPLGQRDHAGACRSRPGASISSSASPIPFEGTARNTRSARSELVVARAERPHLQPLRQRHAGQVVRVLARVAPAARPARRCGTAAWCARRRARAAAPRRCRRSRRRPPWRGEGAAPGSGGSG